MNVELNVKVYMMKLPDGLRERLGKVMKLEHALYGVKQTGRQWSVPLCKTNKILVDKFGIEQCRADPRVFRKMANK